MEVRDVPRLVLDTSAWSHFRSGDDRVAERIAGADAVLLPAVVVGELEAGFALGGRQRENLRALEDFLGEAFTAVVPVDRHVARHYGTLFAALRKAGTPIPTNDIWIAASTLHVNGHLLTFDSDFNRIAGLRQEILSPER